ncbi:MAG TPA: DUF3489 domain-containing protein [Allosphingosinicella sp.]|jgi:hypothetical protein
MAKQPKLSDLQLVLLSTATQRADGNLLPFAESLKAGDTRLPKAIQSLIKRGFVTETEVPGAALAWREEGDCRFGISITPEGTAAIAGEGGEPPVDQDKSTGSKPAPAPAPVKATAVKAGTKQALLVSLLEREEGASIQEIVDATSWQPHTTRAALTGLRKRGFEITSAKVEGVSRYRANRAA